MATTLAKYAVAPVTTYGANCDDLFKELSAFDRRCVNRKLRATFAVLCLNVRGDGNVGTMIRTACLTGCETFYLAGRKQVDKRYSCGANHYMDVAFVKDIAEVTINAKHELKCECGSCKQIDAGALIRFVLAHGYTPCFVEQGGMDVRSRVWKRTVERPLFIFGNETFGVPKATIREVTIAVPSTLVLSLHQWGIFRSHNVAMACGLVLWEFMRGEDVGDDAV